MTIGSSTKTVAIALLAALSLSACGTLDSKQAIGTLGGGVVGGALGALGGHATGARHGGAIGGVLGAVVGAFAGNLLGARLDDADRRSAAGATQQALNQPVARTTSGRAAARPIQWRSPRNPGVSGTAQLVNVHRGGDGQECRDVREVAYVNGEEVHQTSRYCRDNDGRWLARA